MNPTLLVEFGVTQIPAHAMASLAEALQRLLQGELRRSGFETGAGRCFFSHRRLAVMIEQVSPYPTPSTPQRHGRTTLSRAADEPLTRRSMHDLHQHAIDCEQKGYPNVASTAVDSSAATQMGSLYEQMDTLLQRVMARRALRSLRRGEACNRSLLKNVSVMLGSEVLPVQLLGCTATRWVQGHCWRAQQRITLPDAQSYRALLLDQGSVIACPSQRRQYLIDALDGVARTCSGTLGPCASLLDSVNAQIEWPTVELGRLEAEHVQMPQALILALLHKEHVFPVVDNHGALLPYFLAVHDADALKDVRIQRLEARLHTQCHLDQHLWQTECATPLIGHLERLSTCPLHAQLGSIRDQSTRLLELAGYLAKRIGVDPKAAECAALLCKCDATSRLRMQYPTLQGVLSGHYAQRSGHTQAVVQAIATHAAPRRPKEAIPPGPLAHTVAIADKMDRLVGYFGIKKTPKGGHDPFALKHAADGILRIVIEAQYPLDLMLLAQMSEALYDERFTNPDLLRHLIDFFLQRLRALYRSRGFASTLIAAVLHDRPTHPLRVECRIQALSRFLDTEQGHSVCHTYRRLRRFLRTQPPQKEPLPELNTLGNLTLHPENSLLVNALQRLQQPSNRLLDSEATHVYLDQLPALMDAVKTLFDQITIAKGSEEQRSFYCTCLRYCHQAITRIADFSCLPTPPNRLQKKSHR